MLQPKIRWVSSLLNVTELLCRVNLEGGIFFFFNDHLKNQFSKLLKVCESSMKAKQTLTSLWVYILHHLATPGSARSLVSPYFCLQTIQTALRDHERYSVS